MPEKQKIQKLKSYFEKREDIVMAFLFGSRAEKNRVHQHSDWDIAVYFTPEKKDPLDPNNMRIHGIIEWEEQDREYPEEDRVWSDMMKILNTDDVDLIVLNRIPASIADSAIRGIPLVIKDRWLYLEFMLLITREAEDYRQFVFDYYEISERSQSLNARDREKLEKIIKFLELEFTSYEKFKDISWFSYENNKDIQRNIERWIENIVNGSIDASEIILSSQKKLIPSSYRETMERVVWSLKLPENFREKLGGWVKLRNILAHEYLDIKWKRIKNFIDESEPYFLEFIKKVKEFLKDEDK